MSIGNSSPTIPPKPDFLRFDKPKHWQTICQVCGKTAQTTIAVEDELMAALEFVSDGWEINDGKICCPECIKKSKSTEKVG